jgi:uncharacterized membrane-anchored protein YhcB (DUF1043 family)
MGIMKIASRLWGSRSSTAMALTVAAIAVAVTLLASNFTIINAQQQQQQQQSLTSRSGEIENGTTATTTFQSTNDSFSVQVPQGWVIQDLNNTGSALLEESTRGYGLLAQLCPEEQQQQQQQRQVAPPTNASGGTTTNSSSDGGGTSNCQGTQEVIYIIRYPDLATRILSASNVTTATPTTTTSSSNNNNNMTTDNVLSYHLQKLQEVGYRSIQIVNSTEVRLNLTNPQTNETIATVPSRLVEIAYSTNSAPNETRTGYFISTATNGTPPNLGTTKGYAVFYEGNSTNNSTAAEITTATAASGSLAPTPLPPVVGQVFDSFELIASPEVAQTMAQEEPQAAEFAEGAVDDGADDDGGGDDDGADDDGGGDDDGADDDGGGDDDGPDRCISVGGRSTSVTGC